jgi:hypothetical protein
VVRVLNDVCGQLPDQRVLLADMGDEVGYLFTE